MIGTLLIANRGEIACRIIRTAKALGVKTVAVYSDADRTALHVQQADTAIHIGAAPAVSSYLDQQRVIDAARLSGADAIHPGYGFLSENADFAARCQTAGIIFLGPSPEAIRAMGTKSTAKALMVKAGVPVTPGYHGDDQSDATLQCAADDVGYPVLIKASAGGGGKGMRLVNNTAEFSDALASVKREALASFGDDQVLIERYVTEPRHIEIQVAGDAHGNYLHLFERDCSIQRRHQKVVEEAPATGLSEELRDAMGTAAVNAARAIAYQGVGTIEFIVDASQQFYFMEMNTRLQVEHPITEMITGVDLVAWQLSIANGEPLAMSQADLKISGHSIEARLYSEDPNNDFLPATGTLDIADFPEASDTVRIETGIQSGDSIGIHYDPMIAKLVSWGPTRHDAIKILSQALSSTTLAGVTNNIGFIQHVLTSEPFHAGEYSTHFIKQHKNVLTPPPVTDADLQQIVVAAVLTKLKDLQPTNRFTSPWQISDGWRLTPQNEFSFSLQLSDTTGLEQDTPVIKVSVAQDDQHLHIHLLDAGSRVRIATDSIHWQHDTVQVDVEQTQILATTRYEHPWLVVGIAERQFLLRSLEAASAPSQRAVAGNSLKSPMPGQVLQVHVNVGDTVEAGDTLLVVEAMKMEHAIKAPVSGTVSQLFFHEQDRVDANAVLLAID